MKRRSQTGLSFLKHGYGRCEIGLLSCYSFVIQRGNIKMLSMSFLLVVLVWLLSPFHRSDSIRIDTLFPLKKSLACSSCSPYAPVMTLTKSFFLAYFLLLFEPDIGSSLTLTYNLYDACPYYLNHIGKTFCRHASRNDLGTPVSLYM